MWRARPWIAPLGSAGGEDRPTHPGGSSTGKQLLMVQMPRLSVIGIWPGAVFQAVSDWEAIAGTSTSTDKTLRVQSHNLLGLRLKIDFGHHKRNDCCTTSSFLPLFRNDMPQTLRKCSRSFTSCSLFQPCYFHPVNRPENSAGDTVSR
jgi:hypothetical protein